MRSIANAVLLGILALLLSATLTTQDAQAATLEEFNDTCFTESGFEGTDGCFGAAESLGIEMDNLLSSIEQGCTQYFEDYSCKEGSSEPPCSPSYTEQVEVSEQGSTDTQVSKQEPLQLVTEGSYITDYNERIQQAILHDPTMDVVGSSYDTAIVEWISEEAPLSTQGLSEQEDWPIPEDQDQQQNFEGSSYKGYTPITQQGTLAPKDWKSHVTSVNSLAGI